MDMRENNGVLRCGLALVSSEALSQSLVALGILVL